MGQQSCSGCSVCGDDAVRRDAGSRDYAASPPPKHPHKQSEGSPRPKEPVNFKEDAPKESTFLSGGPPEQTPELVAYDTAGQEKRPSWQETLNDCVASTGIENVVKTISQDVEAVENQCMKMQENVNEAVEGAVAKAISAVEDLTGSVFVNQLEKVVDDTLDFMGPRCGDHAVDKMWERYPKLQAVDDSSASVDLKGQATACAVKVVMGFREAILDFCKDIIERIEDGMEICAAAFKTLRKVLVMILKALRGGVNAAVKCVKRFVPSCCVRCMGNLKKLIQECYDFLKGVVQSFVQGQLKERGVPGEVVDQVNWELIEDNAKVGKPKAKDKKFQKNKKKNKPDGSAGLNSMTTHTSS